MKRSFLNFETFGAIGAIIVSVAALFVAWDQATVMRVQQHAAVIPIVTVDMTINQDEQSNIIELAIANVGVGPAMIFSANPALGDQPVDRWSDLSDQLFGEDTPESVQLSASTATTILAAGETATVLAIRWARSDEGDATLLRLAQEVGLGSSPTLSIDLCYCSVLERCWISGRADQNFPAPAELCTPSGDFLETFFPSDEDEIVGEGE